MELTIDRQGKPYSGSYTVTGDIVTVSYAGKTKATQVGRLAVAQMARLLLSELINEDERKAGA